jgi:hypothetical protein
LFRHNERRRLHNCRLHKSSSGKRSIGSSILKPPRTPRRRVSSDPSFLRAEPKSICQLGLLTSAVSSIAGKMRIAAFGCREGTSLTARAAKWHVSRLKTTSRSATTRCRSLSAKGFVFPGRRLTRASDRRPDETRKYPVVPDLDIRLENRQGSVADKTRRGGLEDGSAARDPPGRRNKGNL